ncbi:MAG: hypothetical protein ACFFAQ_04565 [Promethearchaeota archaeon]
MKLIAGILVSSMIFLTLSFYPLSIPTFRTSKSTFNNEQLYTADSNYYYAGWMLYSAKSGVKADITTVDFQGPLPPFPQSRHAAGYINVYLSSNPLYWIQTGYVKRAWWIWLIFFPIPVWTSDFYVETNDASGWHLNYVGKPSAGVTYTYTLMYFNEYFWIAAIFLGSIQVYATLVPVSPNTPNGLYVGVETTHQSVIIDGSHFSDISYYQGGSWVHWSTHSTFYDYPYRINSVSPYEFYAYNG